METVAILGKGRFGRIRCVKTSDGKYLACKEFNRSKAIAEGYVNRILQEKAILQNLSCPYIMAYIDTSKDDETLYLHLEPVLGGGLHLHIQQSNGFSLTICRFYAAQVIAALEYLASRGVIHRDLKANNILLTSQGHIKVCDFGSAKQLVPVDQADAILAVGPTLCPKTYTIIGSAHIMAPETICKNLSNTKNSNGYDFTVDWWALGVLLLEMIYNSIPSPEQMEILLFFSAEAIHTVDTSPQDFWTLCGHTVEDLSAHFNKPLLPGVENVSILSTSEEVYTLFDILKRLLCVSLASRWNIWTIDEILTHPFFAEVKWEEVRKGQSPPLDFDRRLGFLEVIEAGEERKGEEVISETDQALFEGF